MSPIADNQEELMVLAAWMYYDDKLTHEQIAKKLGMSRVSVTRLLQKARREGVVQFRITKPLPWQYDLERRLQKTFGLKDAIVVKTRNSLEDTLDAVGWAGAEHLKQVLRPGCRLGMGWSTTVSRMAPYLEAPDQPVPCTVHEVAGSMLGQTNPYSVSWRIAQVLNVPIETLPVPVVVQSETARDAILKENSIRTALEHARQCDIAFVGLGDVGPDCTMVRTGYLTPEQMADLRRQSAVGDILMHYYDASGRHVPAPLESRIISLDWEDIHRIPYVVAMAAGPTKVEAILGALQGHICHCLITDTDTAQQVLRMVGSRAPEGSGRSMRHRSVELLP